VQQAVNLLGISGVINLVNALSIRGELSDETIIAMSRFWDTSMECAMVSATIAKQIGYPAPDESYTLGLFHNCGVALLMQRFDNYSEIAELSYSQPNSRITDIENEHLTTNHSVVGYYVGKSWKLPPYLCEAIAEHHKVDSVFKEDNTQNSQKKTLLAILKMAEHICQTYIILGRQKTDHEWENVGDHVLEYVGLSQHDFQQMEENFRDMGVGANDFLD